MEEAKCVEMELHSFQKRMGLSICAGLAELSHAHECVMVIIGCSAGDSFAEML